MNAHKIVAALGGRWHGNYGIARCPAHDDRDPSLSIRDTDGGKVLVRCHAGCEQAAILDALRSKGLWRHGRGPSTPRRARRQKERPREAEAAALRALVLTIWRASKPIAATVAEDYLRSRGITATLPPSLRFHPALKHTPTGMIFPAMVAGVQAPDRRVTAIHRTYLLPDGRGKAQVSNPKMMLGAVSGGAVRLAAAGAELGICEGIETGLSFQEATGIPTWCALSTSGLRKVILPPLPLAATVCIAVDLDESGAGEAAAMAAAHRLSREGRSVKIARPIEGNDFNDAIRARSAP